MEKIELEILKISDIYPYDKNNKIHSEDNINEICESIKEFGYLARIGVDENHVILFGEGRYYALKKLGYTEIEVQVISHLTEDKKVAYRILDNKISDMSVYNTANMQADLLWLKESEYSTASTIMGNLLIDTETSFNTLEDALEDTYMSSIEDVMGRASSQTPVASVYNPIFIEKESVITLGKLTIINKEMPDIGNGVIIARSFPNNSANALVVTISNTQDVYEMAMHKPDDVVVWHKGSNNVNRGVFTTSNCIAFIAFYGKGFLGRRYNNLLTAIPSQDNYDDPPSSFFDDLIQNFIPDVPVYSHYPNLAVSALQNGITCTLYIENAIDINYALKSIKDNLYPRSSFTVCVNGEKIEV